MAFTLSLGDAAPDFDLPADGGGLQASSSAAAQRRRPASRRSVSTIKSISSKVL